MARPALIATDLDGTLLDARGQISGENAAALRAAAEAGIELVVATGRPWRWLDVLDELRDLDLHVLASNGAVLYDLHTDTVVSYDVVDPTVIANVIADLSTSPHRFGYALEYVSGWSCDPRYAELSPPLEIEAEVVTGLSDADAVKFLIRCGELSSEQLAQVVEPVVAGRLTCTWSFVQASGMVELSSAGVTKASGLQQVLDRLGIPASQAAAFGDMPNDVTMLQLVGQPYAMANAHPSVLDLGCPVAGHHDDSGVGVTIRTMLG